MLIESPQFGSLEICVVPAAEGANPDSGEMCLGDSPGNRRLASVSRAPVEPNVQAVGDNPRRFVGSMSTMVSRCPAVGDPFRLKETIIAVELDAAGKFQLIDGATAGVTGGLTINLK